MPKTAITGLIMNPHAGSAREAADLKQLFADQGMHIRIFEAADPLHSAKRAVAEGAQALIAAGGDGTVNAVATVAATSGLPLGVLPVGTLNHFAKALQLPLELEPAIGVIVAGKTANVDLAEVNGRIFVNNSSLGLYPSIVRLRKAQQRLGWNKWIALLQAVVLSLRWMPLLHVRLTVDDETIERRTPLLFVGNNEYEVDGGAVGDRKSLTDGNLFVCLANATSPFGLVLTAIYSILGRSRATDKLVTFVTTEATVERRRRRERVALDGEITIMNTPLVYRIRPASLRVFVP